MKIGTAFIYLIGVPAVGKYTTAKEIARLTGAKVIDNQLVNIPIFYIAGYDGTDRYTVSPTAWKNVEKIRKAILSFIEEGAPEGTSFVFTNVLADTAGDRRLFRKIERIARQRDAVFVPVRLTCDAAEIRRRKHKNAERQKRFKDIDTSNIRYWNEEFKQIPIRHPNTLEIDTTNSTPAQTAKRIINHIKSLR
jgi:broad-specificity NMP kinase